jgi:hypothetical protein
LRRSPQQVVNISWETQADDLPTFAGFTYLLTCYREAATSPFPLARSFRYADEVQ